MEMQPVLLLYQIEDAARLKKLRAAARALQIRVKLVQPADYCQPIGHLAGLPIPAAAQTACPPLPGEMAVLCGMTESVMDRLLYAMRQMGTIACKAVLTPTNQDWSGMQLFLELRQEHAQMQQNQN